MTSGAQTREGRFIEVAFDFHGVLLGSQVFWALRWMTSGMIHGDVAS
jgi:hypothetical protein